MSEAENTDLAASRKNIRELVIFSALILSLIHSCGQSQRIDKLSSQINLMSRKTSDSPIDPGISNRPAPKAKMQEEIEREVRAKPHNYLQEEDRFYFYEAPLSDEDKKRGRGTRDVLGYRYFGKDEKGTLTIRLYSEDRKTVISTTKCIAPCKVVNSNGKFESVGEYTVLSEVVEDAVKGALLETPTKNK